MRESSAIRVCVLNQLSLWMHVAIVWVVRRIELTHLVVTLSLFMFWVLTASNGDTCWLSFDRYCLLVGSKAKLIGIESDHSTLVGYRDVRYSKLGNSLVGFCSF